MSSQLPLAISGFVMTILYWIIGWSYAFTYGKQSGDFLGILFVIFICGTMFWGALIELITNKRKQDNQSELDNA